MSIKRTPDPLGIRGDRVTITPDGTPETIAAVAALIAENTPAARIERLCQLPVLQGLADRLAAELVDGSANKMLLIKIAEAEQHAIVYRVAPLVDKARKFTPKVTTCLALHRSLQIHALATRGDARRAARLPVAKIDDQDGLLAR